MKKLVAVAVLGMSVVATVAVGAQLAPAEPEVDQALVQAKIDARLHVLLKDLIASRAER